MHSTFKKFSWFLGIVLITLCSFGGCHKQEKPIAGLKASDIYLVYQKQGFQLDSGETMMWRKLYKWKLSKPSNSVNITILGDADNQVFEIVAIYKTKTLTPEAKTFFEDFIKPLKYDNINKAEIEKWLVSNLGKTAELESGGVTFSTYLNEEYGLGLKISLKENMKK